MQRYKELSTISPKLRASRTIQLERIPARKLRELRIRRSGRVNKDNEIKGAIRLA